MRFTTDIISGKGRGKLLGFPTFNLKIPADLKIKEGIYAARVMLENKEYKGALHFGPIPAFKDPARSLEVFVLDYTRDSTPQTLSFEILDYLRPIQNFATPQALSAQIAKDVEAVRRIEY